jgi:hypothetical protein
MKYQLQFTPTPDPAFSFRDCSPGQIVEVDEVQGKDLLATGEWKLLKTIAEEPEKSEATPAEAKPEPTQPEEPLVLDLENLEDLTVAQLKEIAAKNDIDLSGVTLKADIVTAIHTFFEGGE